MLRAANAAAVERLEALSPAEKAADICRQMLLVVTCDCFTGNWMLHASRYSDFSDDPLNYSGDMPDGVRSSGDLNRLRKSPDWDEVLFHMSQDYDGFHGPHAANLD